MYLKFAQVKSFVSSSENELSIIHIYNETPVETYLSPIYGWCGVQHVNKNVDLFCDIFIVFWN